MSEPIDLYPQEVLEHLKSLGYHHITKDQLKQFIKGKLRWSVLSEVLGRGPACGLLTEGWLTCSWFPSNYETSWTFMVLEPSIKPIRINSPKERDRNNHFFIVGNINCAASFPFTAINYGIKLFVNFRSQEANQTWFTESASSAGEPIHFRWYWWFPSYKGKREACSKDFRREESSWKSIEIGLRPNPRNWRGCLCWKFQGGSARESFRWIWADCRQFSWRNPVLW